MILQRPFFPLPLFCLSPWETFLPFPGSKGESLLSFFSPNAFLSWRRRVATPKARMLSAGGVTRLLKQTLPSRPSPAPPRLVSRVPKAAGSPRALSKHPRVSRPGELLRGLSYLDILATLWPQQFTNSTELERNRMLPCHSWSHHLGSTSLTSFLCGYCLNPNHGGWRDADTGAEPSLCQHFTISLLLKIFTPQSFWSFFITTLVKLLTALFNIITRRLFEIWWVLTNNLLPRAWSPKWIEQPGSIIPEHGLDGT